VILTGKRQLCVYQIEKRKKEGVRNDLRRQMGTPLRTYQSTNSTKFANATTHLCICDKSERNEEKVKQ
jgi:hypothetical protein